MCFSINEEYSSTMRMNYSALNGNIKTDPRMRVLNTEVIVTSTNLHCTPRQMQISKSGPGTSDSSGKDCIQFSQSLCQNDTILCEQK